MSPARREGIIPKGTPLQAGGVHLLSAGRDCPSEDVFAGKRPCSDLTRDMPLSPGGCSLDYTMPVPDILHLVASGYLRETHLEKLALWQSPSPGRMDIPGNAVYVIIDASGLEGVSRQARRRLRREMEAWNQRHPIHLIAVYGASPTVRAAINLTIPALTCPLKMAGDKHAALRLVHLHRDGKRASGAVRSASNMADLLAIIASIDWETAGPPPHTLKPGHPCSEVGEALCLIKRDLDELLREHASLQRAREEDERALARQNIYNRLRADIWKLASDRALSEHELIGRLLEKIGPVLGVSRASYSTFTAVDPACGELRCIRQWCTPGVASSLGIAMPAPLVRFFIGNDLLRVDLAGALETIPPPKRPAFGPLIAALAHEANLESLWLMPFFVDARLEGLLSFDVCHDLKDKPCWDEEVKDILNECVSIVSLFNAQRKTAETLRQSEEKYRSILDAMNTGYFELDLRGWLIFGNEALGRILGRPSEELMGGLIRGLVAPKSRAKVGALLARVRETGRPVRGQWTMVHHDGHTLPVEGTISPVINTAGEATGVRGILNDISQRKQTEALRQAATEAKAANRAKGTFLARMSHEIRTPLNGIIGMTELALDSALNEHQQELLTVIHSEAGALHNLISDILDFSKIEAGKLELEQIPFNLRALIDEFSAGMSLRAKHKGLSFTTHIASDIPPAVVGDPGRLRQILANLTDNALKFTPAGTITLQAVSDGECPDTVRFSVTDTGIGIPRDKQETIFEGFAQADGSTSRRYGGTGLGITISRQLAELMGGKLGLESTEGNGSTFWFTLPFSRQEMPVLPVSEQHAPEAIRDAHILLAEDYPTNQLVARRHLEKAGYMVDVAENGAQAVEAFRRRRYDLILMDILMPVMDGYEAAQAIRALERDTHAAESRVPIVAMTAHAMRGCHEQCLEAGMDDYITKPLSRTAFLDRVDRWLDPSQRRPRDGAQAPPAAGSVRLGEAPLDLVQAIHEFDGDLTFFEAVAQSFCEDLTAGLAGLEEALAAGRHEEVRRQAHAIKGGAANLCALRLARIAGELEVSVQDDEALQNVPALLSRLVQESETLRDYLRLSPYRP